MTGWSELVITESDNIFLTYSFRLLCLYRILRSSQRWGQSSVNDWSTQRGVLSSIRIQHVWQDHRTAKHLSRFTWQRVKYLVEKRATNQRKTMENRQCYCLRKQLLRKFSDKSNLCGSGNLHKCLIIIFFKEFLLLRCWLRFPQSLVRKILSNLKGLRQSSSFLKNYSTKNVSRLKIETLLDE